MSVGVRGFLHEQEVLLATEELCLLAEFVKAVSRILSRYLV